MSLKISAIHELFNSYISPYKFKTLTLDRNNIPLSINNIPLSIVQYDKFLDYLMNANKTPLKILEIGAYVGLFIDFINKFFNEVYIEGIDNCEPFVELAKSKNLKVRLCDVLKLDNVYKQESFDMVLAQNFFHKEIPKFKTRELYFEWIDKIITQVFFILKPNGVFFFDTELFMNINQFTKKGFTVDFLLSNESGTQYHFALLKRSE